MRTLLVALLLLFTTAPLYAQEVDLGQSMITWKGSKVTGSFHEGRLFPKSASVVIKDGKLNSGSIVLDMNTFTVTDIAGKTALRFLRHMKSDDFFDTGKYPTAELTLTSVTGNVAAGQLTIKGKTQGVTFPIRKDGNAFAGTLNFDRTKFGMIYKSGNFFKDLGDRVIKDEVEVRFKIVLK